MRMLLAWIASIGWGAFIRRHADVVAGLVIWQIAVRYLGTRMSPDYGIVTLAVPVAFGVGAYLAVQKLYPESKG